jgi:AmmeMemoRadiSam system protein B
MSFLKLGVKPQILDYKNSGDTMGDRNKVVGYTSIGAFWDD